MPRTIAGVRRALARDRRADERRLGLDDQRAFRMDRRTGERRRRRDGFGLSTAIVSGEIDDIITAIDDDMIVEICDLDDDLFGGAEPGELTQIIELPKPR